jgi:hypothetical protein
MRRLAGLAVCGIVAVGLGAQGCAQQGIKPAAAVAPVLPVDDAATAAARAGILGRLGKLSNLTVWYGDEMENLSPIDLDDIHIQPGVSHREEGVFRFFEGSARFETRMVEAIGILKGRAVTVGPDKQTIVSTFPGQRVGPREEYATGPMDRMMWQQATLQLVDVGLGLRGENVEDWDMVDFVKHLELRVRADGMVEGVSPSQRAWRYVFNPARGYALERLVRVEDNVNRTLAAEDFRDIDGIPLPYKLTNYSEWRRGTSPAFVPMQRQTITVSRYLLNDPTNRSVETFARPSLH